MKTNAARILDDRHVTYRIATYDVDESDLSAPSVARKVGMPAGAVFKTLLVKGDRTGPLFAMISAEQELDTKALAAATGNKRVELVALKDVQPLTGYVRGGVSPLGAKRAFAVVIDASARDCLEIAFSAGVRGAQLVVSPADLVKVTGATVATIGRAAAT